MTEIKDRDDQSLLGQIGRKLRRTRLNADMGQDELALHTGLSRKTIQNAEAGNNYSMETLIRILRALECMHFLDSITSPDQKSPKTNSVTQTEGRQERKRASSRCAHDLNVLQ